MTLAVTLSPEQLEELAVQVSSRIQIGQQPAARLSYTIREAAEVTGASENHIRTAVLSGALHATQAGEGRNGRYLIPTDCLNAWLHNARQPIGRTEPVRRAR